MPSKFLITTKHRLNTMRRMVIEKIKLTANAHSCNKKYLILPPDSTVILDLNSYVARSCLYHIQDPKVVNAVFWSTYTALSFVKILNQQKRRNQKMKVASKQMYKSQLLCFTLRGGWPCYSIADNFRSASHLML